jgi:hypothetical protein
MSDGSLAEQLVDAVFFALPGDMRDDDAMNTARGAASNLLRELEDHCGGQGPSWGGVNLSDLADEIEGEIESREDKYVSPFNTSAPRVKNPGDL